MQRKSRDRSNVIALAVVAFPEPGTVTVEIERRRPSMPEGDDNLGWEKASTATPAKLTPKTASDGVTTWSGNVSRPEPVGTGRYRLAIREFDLGGSPAGRMVYADTIEV